MPKPLARLRDRMREPASEPDARPGWMVWLGGISVAFAGVFLVKYAIDQGLLTPAARVALGTCTGLAMHALAEWLVRRTRRRHPSFSALAAGASVTLSAAALAALHLYGLVSATVAFAWLAAVSLATMALALRHGPVLAALGLIGSYAVPLLVGGDSGRIVEVLAYCLIVSAAVLLMVRYAYRAWLWWGVLGGSLFWWLLSTGSMAADGYRGIYLALVGFALVFLPMADWLPRLRWVALPEGVAGTGWRASAKVLAEQRAAPQPPVTWGLLLLVLAHGVSIAFEPFSAWAAAGWLPLVLAVFLAARWGQAAASLPWISLGVQGIAWLGTGFGIEDFRLVWSAEFASGGTGLAWYAACAATLYSALAWWNVRRSEPSSLWTSLAMAAPACWMAVAYPLATDLAIAPRWAVASIAMGLAYTVLGWLLARSGREALASWTVLGCSASYSLAVAMLFREAGLTLALALQAAPLAWLAARLGAANVSWMAKVVLAAVVLRLTANPWLPAYAEGPHWVLWTYGGSTFSCLLAGWLARPVPGLRRWFEAAAAHLLVLTGWFVTRDALYGSELFSADYSFREAAVNTAYWAALGLVYHRRSLVSEHLAAVYGWAARILLGLSLVNYALVLVALNPALTRVTVASTKVWNELLLAYGAPVLLAWLVRRYYEPCCARFAGGVAAVALFAFVTIEIRHLWQGGLDAIKPPTDGEMATYSVVWLVMAVAGVLGGGLRFGRDVYRGGMVLLALTICKVFAFDMGGLTGLLRAGSFMGLGLSLLALSYLHQKFGSVAADPGDDAA